MGRKKKLKEEEPILDDPILDDPIEDDPSLDGDGERVVDDPTIGDETMAEMEAEASEDHPAVADPPDEPDHDTDGGFVPTAVDAPDPFTDPAPGSENHDAPEWDPKTDPLPTIEELIRGGFSLKEAEEEMDELKDAFDLAKLSGRPYFEVTSPLRKGFWKVGRHFVPGESKKVFLDELSEEDLATMKIANKKHLTVKCVGFNIEDI